MCYKTTGIRGLAFRGAYDVSGIYKVKEGHSNFPEVCEEIIEMMGKSILLTQCLLNLKNQNIFQSLLIPLKMLPIASS